MKSIKTIKDPKAFELLADETRRKIVYLLRVKEMTVSQIASELNLTAQAIYHHVRKMKAGGIIEVSREERVGHFIETYYRSAAEMLVLSHGEAGRKQSYEETTKDTLHGLAKLGLIDYPSPEVVSRVAKIVKEIDTCCKKHEWVDKIGEMGDIPFFIKQNMTEFAPLLGEDDKQFQRSIELQTEMRELLLSCCCHEEAKSKRKKK